MGARLYPSNNPSPGRFRKRSIYAASRGDRGRERYGRFNGRGLGRGRRGRGERGRGGHVKGGWGWGSGAHENGLTSQMSPVTLKIQSGPHSQTIKGKGSLRTRYANIYWQIKRGTPPAL